MYHVREGKVGKVTDFSLGVFNYVLTYIIAVPLMPTTALSKSIRFGKVQIKIGANIHNSPSTYLSA